MNTMPSPEPHERSTTSQSELDISAILARAAMKNATDTMTREEARLVEEHFAAEFEALQCTEVNIRGWAMGQEAAQWRANLKQYSKELRQLERDAAAASVATNDATATVTTATTTGSDEPTLSKEEERLDETTSSVDNVPVVEAPSTQTIDELAEAMRVLLLNETNIRYALVSRHNYELTALDDLFTTLRDDLSAADEAEDPTTTATRVPQPETADVTRIEPDATEPQPATEVADEATSEVVDDAPAPPTTTSTSNVDDDNAVQPKDVHDDHAPQAHEEANEASTQDAPATLIDDHIPTTRPAIANNEEAEVERRLNFHPTPPGLPLRSSTADGDDASPTQQAGSGSPSSSYPRHCKPHSGGHSKARASRDDVTIDPLDTPVPAALPEPSMEVPAVLSEDEDTSRTAIADEWFGVYHVMHEAWRSYLTYEYDWSLAGWRRVVKSDADMFRRQGHLPASLRSPQKNLFHEHLGILDRSAENVSLTVRTTSPSSQRHQQFSRTYPHGAATPLVPNPPSVEPPRRAKNDSLLQNLLYQESATRTLLAHDAERELEHCHRSFEEDLHREMSWSRGWCATENARQLQPALAQRQRHLPAGFRLGTDPKVAPIQPTRPPSDYYVTPQRRTTQQPLLEKQHANTDVLKLPIPRDLLLHGLTDTRRAVVSTKQ